MGQATIEQTKTHLIVTDSNNDVSHLSIKEFAESNEKTIYVSDLTGFSVDAPIFDNIYERLYDLGTEQNLIKD